MDGTPPPEEDFTTLSVSDRLAHKNWKARVSGYETLVKTFQNTASDTDPAFRPYLSNPDTLKKIVTDANVVAQEKGVEAVVALVKFAGENAARTREAVVPALVDKCLGSTRAGTKAQAIELVLQYAEVENGGAGVVADILPGLAAKQPKAVAGTVSALKELIRQFGTQAIPPPPILKALPKIFAHTDKTVRAEGTLLAQSLYQCIGPGIESWLADLKPVQVKELKEGFEKMDSEGTGKGKFQAQRYTRQQAREMESGAGADEGEEAAEEMAAPDPRAFAEEVDIVSKLPSGLQAGLASSKWKERKEVLDELLTLLNATQRIKDAPEFGEIVKGLAGRMSDANINCVIAAANCLEALAKGLMGSFSRFRETAIPPMLERLKERKQSVCDALGNALDAVFATSNLPDVINDVLPALGSKNPQVKEGCLKFLTRCFSTSTAPPAPPQVKPLSEALAGLLEDSFEGARNEAATALGTLMKIVGERPLNAILDQLADVRKVKVKDAFEKAAVKCKAGSGGPPKPPPPASKAPAAKKAPAKAPKAVDNDALLEDESPPKPTAKPPARLMKKAKPAPVDDEAESPKPDPPKPAAKPPARLTQAKKPTAPPTAPAAVKGAKAAASAAPGALDTFKYRHTPEDAEALAADLIPANISTDLGDANWKTRLAATEEMTSWLEGVAGEVDSEVVVRFIAKKGWNEKNFQVSSKLYGILCILAGKSSNFGRSCIALSVPHLSEKLGDMKLKKPAGETLMLFAEKTSLQFVLSQAYDTLSKQKAPKVLADSISWIESALNDFGVAGVSLRGLIDFLKAALGNSNAAVRTSATKALVKIKIFVGPSVKDLLGEINPQLLSTISNEFDKVEGQGAPEPTRTSADVKGLGAISGSGSSAAAGDAMDDLFPRVEIDGLLKGTSIIADAKSDQWKVKKEALETLQAILDQGPNRRLKPSMGEIGQVLKARVTDTNKAVQLLALDIVARIASGMNKPFDKQTRFFAQPVASALSDQKSNIRAAALQTLTAMAEACEGLDSMAHFFTAALETPNPLQRSTLLGWIADWFKNHEPPSHLDLSEWVAPVVSCLEDRSGDVRKAAQAVLPFIVGLVGFDKVMQQTNSLKPASRAAVVPLVKAAAAAAPTSAPPPTKQQSQPVKAAPAAKFKEQEPEPVEEPSPPPVTPAPGPSKLNGVRRKLPQAAASRPDSRASMLEDAPSAPSRTPGKPSGSGIKRPGSVVNTRPASSTPVTSASAPFTTMNLDAKKTRLHKDGIRFVVEPGPVRKDLVDLLHSQMEPHASKELLSLLFSQGHDAVNDYIAGEGILNDFYLSLTSGDDKYGFSPQERQIIGTANADLVLKYVSIRIHETMPSLISKCLDLVENVMAFFRDVSHQVSDPEALVFIPTMINKLGDAREAVRIRVQQIIQTLPKVYPYSRLYQLLLDYGLKSKVAKTRQGAIDELSGILKHTGISACDPQKSFPILASMISDKDATVRKSALSCLSEGYVLIGEKLWSYVGPLNPKDKTQLEERLRRVAGPSNVDQAETGSAPPSAGATSSRFPSGVPRPASRIGGIPRPASPALPMPSRLARPASPSRPQHPASSPEPRAASPAFASKLSKNAIPTPTSPRLARPKSFLPSRLGPSRSGGGSTVKAKGDSDLNNERPALRPLNGDHFRAKPSVDVDETLVPQDDSEGSSITVTISKILSNDPSRSVNALKQIQRILEATPEEGPSNPQYRDLSDHTEGLVDTITLQMAHAFDKPSVIGEPENFRLAKHLIQTINAFCDHPILAESLQVVNLTPLFEELTLRLLQTDESDNAKVKDLSRFINLIILRLFATGRRMTVLRSLFALLLQIVKPFPINGTLPESREAKVAELVLKCIWKLARNIPGDLEKQLLDPIELFPAIEHFLQSIPPNEWRARATNKVPSGDMPLRTIKVIIQHVVAFYGDVVYDMLSSSFDDPSATIVYPYVFRILNTSRSNAEAAQPQADPHPSPPLPSDSQPGSTSRPHTPAARSSTASIERRSPSRRTESVASSVHGGNFLPPPVSEPDPDEQLITIINHISSETTGAMHKEGITELHHFLKAYPHKKPRVDRMLDNTGPAFRKYIARALASRAAEDEERGVAVADTLSRLESKSRDGQYGSYAPRNSTSSNNVPMSPKSPKRGSQTADVPPAEQEKLNRLHDLFHYRSSTASNGSSVRSDG